MVLWWVLGLVALWLGPACGQQAAGAPASCYGGGALAAAAALGALCALLLVGALYYFWKRLKDRRRAHLILETDAEKGKGEYAFDNPGFKDANFSPLAKIDNQGKGRWPVTAAAAGAMQRALDDSAIDANQVKVVALSSQDFTGLGFSICGNMKEGIYIKDVLHRGPASESGRLGAGDRINSVTISFEHMVYEDALAILGYASPYEVMIEARAGRGPPAPALQAALPRHPVCKSSSCVDLVNVERLAKKRLFVDGSSPGSDGSSLQKSLSNMTTLERREPPSPQNRAKKPTPVKFGQFSPDQLKMQLERKILMDHTTAKDAEEVEKQKTENKLQKFGVRVLPIDAKKDEQPQNDNNINIEKYQSIDEVDRRGAPQARRRERRGEEFERQSSLTGSGIKRDQNGIPQEIPSYMMNAAVAARSNRKNSDDKGKEDTPKRKGKAPPPPPPERMRNNLDEIQTVADDEVDVRSSGDCTEEKSLQEEIEVELRNKENRLKDYNSDSDVEGDNQSSVNTIELNSSDITIHHSEGNEDSNSKQNRRTASTGDLTKMQKNRSNTGTLERAQSLDITDAAIPSLNKKRKGARIEDDLMSDNDLFGKMIISKEPRLSLMLDGLNTFQRNRLKKSTEWGNLEDAILSLENEQDSSGPNSLELSVKTKEFDALLNKINEIKRESITMTNDTIAIDMVEEMDVVKPERKVKNQIWPMIDDENGEMRIVEITEKKHLISNEDIPMEVEMIKSITTAIDGAPKDVKTIVKSQMNLDEKDNVTMMTETKNKNIIWPIKDANEKHERRQQKPNMNQLLPPDDDLPLYKSIIDDKIPLNSNEYYTTDGEDDVHSLERSINKCDEVKTGITFNQQDNRIGTSSDTINLTQNFILSEQIASNQQYDDYKLKHEDTNISDDIKVSRHSLGSLKRPKSDDVKSMMNNNNNNISNVTVNNDYTSLEIADASELYTTAIDNTSIPSSGNDESITFTTSELVQTINNDVTIHGPSSLTLEIPKRNVTMTKLDESLENEKTIVNHKNRNESTMTYITEIQVMTPSNNTTSTNISEIEIIPSDNRNLDREFEDYVKKFESNGKFEFKMDKMEKDNSKSIVVETIIDAEKELHKIHEIAEEQLKKLPEMRFTTSTYEKPIPDRKQGQIEALRSNFERSPPKKPEIGKSRIPIATTMKTPPTSPERRDSRNLDMENDKAILELMSSVHSTPKYPSKTSINKNVTITSIRSNSKIPSGLPVLGGSRPPIPPRKVEHNEETAGTNGVESSFKQWVFNPDNPVTNIVVTEDKQHK